MDALVRAILRVSLILLGTLLWTATIAAQSATELRSTADYDYGQTMRFRLQASNLGEVQRVTLFFRPHTSTEAFAVDIPIQPDGEIDVSYALDLTQTRLPPFSSVAYWWELERVDGATLRVPERTLSYVDDQFSWQWLTKADPEGGGVVTVQWTGDNPDVGETAYALVLNGLERLAPYVPLAEVQPFNVFVYPSSADLGAAMRLAGRDWQPGQSYPELGVLLVTAVNDATAESELRQGIGRELTELLLYQALGDDSINVPLWVRNGLSVVASGGNDPRSADLLAEAVAGGTAIPLRELCAATTGDGPGQPVALAQSGELISFIDERYGAGAVTDLIVAFAAGMTCEAAFDAALQTTPAEVDQQWRAQVQPVAEDRGAIAQAIIWLLLVLAGFGLAALVVRRPGRDRKRF